MESDHPSDELTFLFTDIEGSTRLWEEDPERMRPALSKHNALARGAVERHRGTLVKLTGDGVYATFADSLDALHATLELQQALADPAATDGVTLPVRCGLHSGVASVTDDDLVGSHVNRAARIMSAAHGGQILLSHAVVESVQARLPREVSLRDLGSVWLRDIASPQHLYQAVHAGLQAKFPALRSLAHTPNNLPQHTTAFVGRERALSDVVDRLREVRLLTVAGTGGLGKTRLALEVAAKVLPDHLDGVWFVDLAPLSSAEQVPQAVAFVLGVKEESGRPLVDALRKFVKDRRLLLVLDNCEHVLDACAKLASALLQAGAHVKVMATSREALHATGEFVYPLSTLAVPAPDEAASLDALSRYEAVRLFRDRAAAALPGFELDADNAAAAADICRRLDGLPLAIELAAARVRALSVEKIAERLEHRFRLLGGGDPARLPRQQTLTAAIDWSYDLLSERERTLFARLAVFAGGFTLEAAEAVGIGRGLDEIEVVETLVKLVEKSLVVLERDHYRLLETVRQYAMARLADSADESDSRNRHLAYYVALAEGARPELAGRAQGAWLARFDVELDNFLAAHAWCARPEVDAALGLRWVEAFRLYWLNRGMLELGHRVTVEALDRPAAKARTKMRGMAAFVAGQLSFFTGRHEEALAHLGESLAIAREFGDENAIRRSLTLLGVVCLGREDLAMARQHLEEALELARGLGDSVGLASTLNAVAELRRTEGQLDKAEALYEESLSVRRMLGDRDAIAIDLLNLSVVAIGRGHGERARSTLREAHAIAVELGSRKLGQAVLDAATGLCTFVGEPERAARFAGASLTEMERMGLQREPSVAAFVQPFLAQAQQALGEAAFAAAEAAGRKLDHHAAAAEAGAWLAGRWAD